MSKKKKTTTKKKFKIDLKNKNTLLTIGLIGSVLISLLFIYLDLTIIIPILALAIASPFLFKFFKNKKINKNKSKEKANKPKKKKWKVIVNRILMVCLILGILGIIAVAGFIIYIVKTAPNFDPENLYTKEATIVYDNKNNIIAELGREKRENVTYDELPQVLIDAIIATEDSRFFQHNGFDLPRFVKATFGQLTGNSSAGGASTLTMQVVKNNFTSKKQTITRKLTDIYMAIWKLEKVYTKEEILEFYVNAPYLGSSSYGVEQACKTYFGKSVGDINLAEASLIAGLFQLPGAYDPYLHPEAAEKRRGTVLYLMKKHGYINEEEYKAAKAITIDELLVGKGSQASIYQGYIDTVVDEVLAKTEYNPYNVPMIIYTNMDRKKQDHANKVLKGEIFKFPDDIIQTGFVATEVNTGKIVAIGTGRNRDGERLYNFATMSENTKRQIGSTAKPIFDYGPAFEFLNWSTYHPLLDEEYTYSDGTPISNWDGKYWGLLTLREAFKESRNIPALKTFQELKNSDIVSFATSLGITPELSGGKAHEAHAIGGFNGASPLEMSGAYAAFANGGYYIEPYTVSKIIFKESEEEIEFKPQKERVMKETTAFMVTSVLDDNIVPNVNISAKTGTTNLDDITEKKWGLPNDTVSDAWVVGYTPNYSIAMWYGYAEIDEKYYMTTNEAWGQRKPLFKAIADGILDFDKATFKTPKGISRITVEKETVPAMLPSEGTPNNMKVTEYFIKGTEPTEISPRFSNLNNITNLDGDFDNNDNTVTLTWDYELPTHLTTAYLDEYYQDVFGTFKTKYLNARYTYDKNTLGNIGFQIYKKNADGTLTSLGFTNNKTFTHSVSVADSVTYIIKTAYSKYKKNISSGAEITISLGTMKTVSIDIDGIQTVNLNVGDTYNTPDPTYIVLEDFVNVTSEDMMSKTITKTSTNTTVEEIVTTTPEVYIIEYKVTYKTHSETFTRTVTIE